MHELARREKWDIGEKRSVFAIEDLAVDGLQANRGVEICGRGMRQLVNVARRGKRADPLRHVIPTFPECAGNRDRVHGLTFAVSAAADDRKGSTENSDPGEES